MGGMTAIEYLFFKIEPQWERISSLEAISIFCFLCTQYDISLLSLLNILNLILNVEFGWSSQEVKNVATLILDHCVKKHKIDLRIHFMKLNADSLTVDEKNLMKSF